ncbi:MAG: molecular chaperone DnaJ, partial [Streptosporangiaceae bacterium]
MNLAEALERLDAAPTPEDLFGPDPREATRAYHRLARLLHPDAGTDGRAFTRLGTLWRAYGTETTIRTRRHTYTVGRRETRGDLADLFPVSPGALLKLPRDKADNDLLAREAVALRQLPKDGDVRYLPYVPKLIETFRVQDRQANVITRLDGFVTLTQVRDARPGGVDPRDAAWMWRRLLVALGFAHRAGVLHGAVLPEHVLIHPGQHGLTLLDWCYSVPGCYAHIDGSGRVPALVARRSSWYPPEVPAK